MQMDDCAALGPAIVHGQMKKVFFARVCARKMFSVPIQFCQCRRIPPAETRIRWGQNPTVFNPSTDIATASRTESPAIQTETYFNNAFSNLVFLVHDSCSQAFVKKSSLPKFPDFKAKASWFPAPVAKVHGTPGSISGPILSKSSPNLFTTAPEVSPPATINWVTPFFTNPAAISAKACSQSELAFSKPSSFWFLVSPSTVSLV